MNKRKGLNMEQKRNLTGWAFLLPASLLIFVFCFYPMVQALILSFQKGTGSAVQTTAAKGAPTPNCRQSHSQHQIAGPVTTPTSGKKHIT